MFFMVKKLHIKESKCLKEYNDGDIVTWEDLNEAQKNYVVEHAYEFSKLEYIWEFYNESLMDWYHEEVNELANKYAEQGIDINTDKIYWQSNSQGPYPEWRFEDIFDTVYVDYDGGEVVLNIYGRGTEPTIDFDLSPYTDADGDYEYEYNLELGDLTYSDYNVPDEVVLEVEKKASAIENFVDKVWELINTVCTSYPDDEYIRGELDNYPDDDFMIISDTEAKPVRA